MAPSLPFYVFSSNVDKMTKYDISISVYNENEIASGEATHSPLASALGGQCSWVLRRCEGVGSDGSQ